MKTRFVLAIFAVCMVSPLGGCNGPATYITKSSETARGAAASKGITYPTGPDTSVFAGALVDGSIGQSMDESDRIKITQTLEMSRAGYTIRWRNPNTGVDYLVTPARTYETVLGPCREFTTQAVIDGQRQSVRGSACRQPNGVWQASP